MRVLIVARLSRKADGQTGIETQDHLTRQWTERNGHTVREVVADSRSGTTQPWDRPNLRPWVTDPARIGQYDAIAAYRLDRLSRGDDESTTRIEDWAREHGKLLLTEDGLIYPCEGNDGIRWDVTKRIAHQEWLNASERYTRMQRHLRANGYLVGRPPFGYVIVPSGDHKRLAIDPVTGPWVREAFARIIVGESLASVASTAPGGRMWERTLGAMIRNPVYRGRRTDGVSVPPIVTAAVWRQANASLDSRKGGKRGPAKEPALLTGVLRCGKCHGPMYRINARAGLHYRCAGRGPQRKGCGVMVPLAKADETATGDVLAYGHLDYYESRTVPGSGHEDEVSEVVRDIRDLDPLADNYDSRLTTLRTELSRLRSLPSEPARTDLIPTGQTIAQRWERLDTAGRRKFLLDHGAEWTAKDGEVQMTEAGEIGLMRAVRAMGGRMPRKRP